MVYNTLALAATGILAAAQLATAASIPAVPRNIVNFGVDSNATSFDARSHVADAAIRKVTHAKMAKRSKSLAKKAAIYSGGGKGTLYYDMNGGGTCGAANGWSSYPETNGYAACEPNSGYKTLAQRGSNRVVAVPSEMLVNNKAAWCGKEVSVTWNGKTVNNLIVWDGCAACNENGGLDFSSTVFAELFGSENCGRGKIDGLSWQILDNQIWSASNGDPVGSSSSYRERSTSSSASPSSSSKPWSASSSWVSASTSSKEEPSSRAQITATKGAYVRPTEANFVAQPVNSTVSTDDAAPTASTTVTAAPAPSDEEDKEDDEEEEESPSAAPVETAAPAPSAVAGTCNDTPGSWQCSGNTLQQCVQTPQGWSWSTRVKCEVEPINCGTPNPVCPKPASGL